MKKIFTILVLLTCSLFVKAQTYSWNGMAPIFDFQSDTINITVSGITAVIDTNFGIAHICLDITHTFDNDLVITLFSPDGDSAVLIQNIGGSSDNFLGTCLGMDGVLFTNVTAPYTGLFLPVGNVAALNDGQNPNGVWKIVVKDVAGQDTGSVHHASLEFTNNPPRLGSIGTGPSGIYVCSTCICPGGAAGCDLLPDLIASAKEIQDNHTETPGFLYLSNATPNIGAGPLEIFGIDSCFCGTTHVPCTTACPSGQLLKHVVKQRIYQKVPGSDTLTFYDRFAGTMVYHPTHGHLHVEDFASYTLRTATSNPDASTWPIVSSGTKTSFCLINLGTCAGNPGECLGSTGNIITTVTNQGFGFHSGCGLTQGIYSGSYDVYSIGLNDPIPLNNVCNGNYYIVSITDENNNFLESDETNNWVAVPITLTQQNPAPSITASGPLSFCAGDSVILTANTSPTYLWSTGATTQSIVVKTAGMYAVAVNCGTSSNTSPAVTTSIIPNGATPSISVAVTTGSNPTCPSISVTFTATTTFAGATPAYQWKVNGVNAGTNSPTFTSTFITSGQIVTCVLTSSANCLITNTVTSNAITVGLTVCYCTPIYGTTSTSGCLNGDVIAHFVLNTLDNNSGSACPSGIAGYTNYSSSTNPFYTTTLQAGNTYTCTVTAGQYGEGYKVWIDYNNDGVFSASEVIGNSNGIVAGSGSVGTAGLSQSFAITVPCNVSAGVHRLRVRCSNNNAGANIDPCIYMNAFGETEDYNITISPAVACPKPSAQTAINPTSTGATLGWAAGCTETVWNVHVTAVGGGAPVGAGSNPSIGNPFTVTGLKAGAIYEYWVAANCTSSGNGLSAWTGPYQFTTLPNCAIIPGTSFANPILVGQAPCATAPFINTKTNSVANCFSNSYTGATNQAALDVWYKFILAAPATVQISHCASAFDTYLHLLDSTGTQIAFDDDNGPLCSGLMSSISMALSAGTYYVVSEAYGNGVGAITTKINTIDVCPAYSVLNVKCLIQGYWNGFSVGMLPVLVNQGVAGIPSRCDSIEVELHSATIPFSKLYSTKTIMNQNGTIACNFPLIYGTYYIALKHRNAIQTWSANTVAISHIPLLYDFTTNSSKAYGSNQIQIAPNIWALYSGDINKDENIDLIDISLLEYDTNNFAFGYFNTDLNGDGNVDLLDNLVLENNINNFIYSVHP